MSTSLPKLVNNLTGIYSKNVDINTANLNVSLKGLKITNFVIITKSIEINS